MPIPDGVLGALSHEGATQQILKPANPTPGAVGLIAPPGQYIYEVLAGSFTLTNSATTAVGNPQVAFLDGDQAAVFTVSTGAALAASTATTINFAVDVDTNVAGGVIVIPKLLLYPGEALQLGISSGLATVQVSNVRVWLRRYVQGDGGRIMSGLPLER